MIVRERQDDIVMITQDDHARVSGVFASYWKDSFFYKSSQRDSVELAINEHDRGWIMADSKPFLNDRTMLLYSFMDFPTEPKLVFYKNGIDEVEEIDDYAGLLCSHHYARFAAKDASKESQRFVERELDRQHRIKQMMDFDKKAFQFHYHLLSFCDNLSLYACLNEPGATKEEEHYFFKKGLPVPSTFSFFTGDPLSIRWMDTQTILLSELPFDKPVVMEIRQKVVSKEQMAEDGILLAYENAPVERIKVQLMSG